MNRRTRVLHVILNLNYGGMERLLVDMVRRIDRTQFDVHVLCIDYLGIFAEGLDRYAGVHLLGPQPRLSMLRPRALIDFLRRLRPDVVHSHSGAWYKSALAARRAGVPLILHTDHGRPEPDPWRNRFFDGLASRNTDVVVAVSEPLAHDLRRTIVARGVPIRVILNGVDTARFHPRPDDGGLRDALGLPPDVPVLGSIGRLAWDKGYDVVIDAFARLRTDWRRPTPAPVLVIAGDGAERADLERRIARHRLGDAVHLLGWRDDAPSLLAGFSVFTLASRMEGTSISLLEAMSTGIPSIVTDVGGNAAVLGPELRHALVPPDDAAALAAAWADLLADPDRARRDGIVARRRVERHFSVEATVREYEQLYREGAP
ncbi:MAG TPA: glycosyltransferase [Longimicrobiales bacterium]